MKPALVLLSGGIDSTTALYVATEDGYSPTALVFRYGQRHAVEIEHALALCRGLGVPWKLQDLDLRAVGGSALTSDAIDVPVGRRDDEVASGPIPPTYVPARNTIFLAFALAWAEVLRIEDIFIGVNALDYSGYPDCRPEYIAEFERLANLACRAATEGGARIRLHTPLIAKTKAEIVRLGAGLGVDFSRTWSCYAPRRRRAAPLGVAVGSGADSGDGVLEHVACGECDSCVLRRKGFREAGVPDPTVYFGSV